MAGVQLMHREVRASIRVSIRLVSISGAGGYFGIISPPAKKASIGCITPGSVLSISCLSHAARGFSRISKASFSCQAVSWA